MAIYLDQREDMYNHVYDEMVKIDVEIKFDEEAVWMDADGNECSESKAFGRKVTHKLIYPEFCIVGDEVGSSTTPKGGKHIG